MGGKRKPSKFNLAIRGILIILGIIISTYALTMIPTQVQTQQQIELEERQAKIDALQGNSNPYLIDMTKTFTYHLGKDGVTGEVPPETLANGFKAPNDDFQLNGALPIEIKIVDNHLSISANITNANNEIVGEIRDNAWKDTMTQSLLNLYDKNSNNFAFEVVDKDKTPLLQIYFMGPNELDITGFFHTSDGSLTVVTDNSVYANPSVKPVLEPFFLYPSDSHPSELAHPELFLPPDNSIPFSAWLNYGGMVLAVLGYSLSGLISLDSFWRYR
jgi:hypothetical protein